MCLIKLFLRGCILSFFAKNTYTDNENSNRAKAFFICVIEIFMRFIIDT